MVHTQPPVVGNKHEFKQRNGSVTRPGALGNASLPVQPQTKHPSSPLQWQEQTLRLSFAFGETICAGNQCSRATQQIDHSRRAVFVCQEEINNVSHLFST